MVTENPDEKGLTLGQAALTLDRLVAHEFRSERFRLNHAPNPYMQLMVEPIVSVDNPDIQLKKQIQKEYKDTAITPDGQKIRIIPIVGNGGWKTSKYEVLTRLKWLDRLCSRGKYQEIYSGKEYFFDIAVIKELCRTISENQSSLNNKKYSINLDGQTISNMYLPSDLKTIFTYYNIDPGIMTFEITETGFPDLLVPLAYQNIKWILDKKNGLGASGVYLDDFGEGSNNMDRLKELPFTGIKYSQKLPDNNFYYDLPSSPLSLAGDPSEKKSVDKKPKNSNYQHPLDIVFEQINDADDLQKAYVEGRIMKPNMWCKGFVIKNIYYQGHYFQKAFPIDKLFK
ncbi:MAG: EAL domain-containing protein [Nanoarchaeota archaeon]|nr:EAL domain-containing protein [Nanoarchaeota archaeon]